MTVTEDAWGTGKDAKRLNIRISIKPQNYIYVFLGFLIWLF